MTPIDCHQPKVADELDINQIVRRTKTSDDNVNGMVKDILEKFARFRRLVTQIRCRWPLTYFLTFSCNFYFLIDVTKSLLVTDERSYGDPTVPHIVAVPKLIEVYPFVVSRYFMAVLTFSSHNHKVCGQIEDDF